MTKKVLRTFFIFTLLALFSFLFVNFFFVERTLTDWIDTNGKEVVKEQQHNFSFALSSDMRYFIEPEYEGEGYTEGGLQFIKTLNTDFMIVAGDLDPVSGFDQMVEKYIGEEYKWYPVVGNHELPENGKEEVVGANIEYIRNFEIGEVNSGPEPCSETTYSFDHMSVHFVVLNEYCDVEGDTSTVGNIPELLMSWLKQDLETNDLEQVIVIGHEPAFVFPDEQSFRLRHEDDSLNQFPEQRDMFWDILEEYDVDAYLCGHTHNYSSYEINGVWQIDAGHMRGIGDTGALSTVVLFTVFDDLIEVDTYRADEEGLNYSLYESFELY